MEKICIFGYGVRKKGKLSLEGNGRPKKYAWSEEKISIKNSP
jgi:hypothetical protein